MIAKIVTPAEPVLYWAERYEREMHAIATYAGRPLTEEERPCYRRSLQTASEAIQWLIRMEGDQLPLTTDQQRYRLLLQKARTRLRLLIQIERYLDARRCLLQ